MPRSNSVLQELLARIARLLATPPWPEAELLTVTLPAPPGWAPSAAEAMAAPAFGWHLPGSGERILGLDIAWQATCSGPGRWHRLAAALSGLKERWQHLDPDRVGPAPLAFVGAAFGESGPLGTEWSAFPNSLLAVPALTLRGKEGSATLTFASRADRAVEAMLADWRRLLERLYSAPRAAAPGPGAAAPRIVAEWPGPEEWRALVATATAAIRRGELRKVVAVRRVTAHGSAAYDPSGIAARLARLYPECRIVSVALGHSLLVAASPERLVRLEGGQVTCDALGGSAGRGPDDRALAEALLASPKARQEHAMVLEGMLASLGPLCESLAAPATPAVARFRNILHLWSEVHGRCRPGVSVLDLARRLHPTPAVGGLPRDAARAWLASHNPLARGWYTGAAGWVDTDGEGELAVLLRCALMEGGRAHLYAGAGLVADSDPEAEYAETGLKLMPMLEALAVREALDPETSLRVAAFR